MPFWLSVNDSNWWSPLGTTTSTTSVTTSTITRSAVWYDDGGTGPLWASSTPTVGSYWNTQQGLWQQASMTSSDPGLLYMQQRAASVRAAQERYAFAIARGNWLEMGSLFTPSAPAIISPQDELRRTQAAYQRALDEHNEQEQARILRDLQRLELSAEEARRRLEEQQQREAERREEVAAAKARARELLIEHLTPEQRDTFDRNGWFIVEGGKSKQRYRIRAVEHMSGNVDVLTAANRVAHRLCAHVPVGRVPLGDQLLAQKIMLELAEDDFLRTANRHAA